ncbi:MAG: RNA polymerase subunit sigma-70 [Ignavibacteriae bacterium HGW-Ignavibacteriae-4]|jgi:RNA polymerase sigma-70 factor (ECF subfamily)|nr:MAG: RNA polymerase subunit sigma-70 [Ignavibacteriae bacterium HGW-Ignavibacteriae-4]
MNNKNVSRNNVFFVYLHLKLFLEGFLSEIDLIQQIANGDKRAFRELYDLHSAKVYNIALSYSQDVSDAEEITQDVFTSIFKYASKFKSESKVSTWIYRITVNTALNYQKKKKRARFFSLTDSEYEKPDFNHPGTILEYQEQNQLLFKAINTLPESQKSAFILSYIEENPRQDVADIMDTSLKAVESLLHRAKANLRKELEKYYPNRRIVK